MKANLNMASNRRAFLALAALLLALAAWLAWSAWGQWQDGSREGELLQVRDQVVQSVTGAASAQTRRLDEWRDSEPARAAIAAGRADQQLRSDWAELESTQLLPADLTSLYADPAASGYGRLAVAEAALGAGAATSRVVAIEGSPRLLLATPVSDAAGNAQILLATLPADTYTRAVHEARLPSGSYLALRQGSHALAERGDTSLAGQAESLARKIEGTGMRVAAGLPNPVEGVFGLGAIPALVAAVLLALAAAVLAMLGLGRRIQLPTRGAKAEASAADARHEPTLAETIAMQPAPVVAPVVVEQADAGPPPPTGTTGVALDAGIFRAYDIRGVVGPQLDRETAMLIGQAIGSVMAEQDQSSIVVGRDGRLSGPELVDGLIEGLRSAGRDVVDIGMVPTPVVYFATYHLRTGCGVAVTGSHNPPDYNGFKIVVAGTTLSGDAITALHQRIQDGRLHVASQPGGLARRDVGADYVNRIAGDVQLAQPLKVVVDAGNGVAGELGPQVLEAVGADVIPLYCDIDGTFPNHHPDPSEPHNLNDLVQMVQRTGADLGIAFDGDGDRLGVVTREGHNIFPDRLLMLFAEDVLERNPGAMIIYDVKCSGRLAGHVLRHGGSPLMWKTGHSLVKAKMRETDAELAGEMSGHFFFGERWYGFDDGIYAAARLLEILSQRDEAPGDVMAQLPEGVSTPEIKVAAPGDDPHAFVDRFQANASFEGARNTTIDGLRVDWDDGWGLVRASNTTPVLVMRFDADTPEALARIQGAFREQLLALDADLPLPF